MKLYKPMHFVIVGTALLFTFSSFFLTPDSAFAQNAATVDQQEENQDKAEPEKSDASGFIRISRDAEGNAQAMQTSVTRYEFENEDGDTVTVDLIGVVHVGEQEYYEQFNEQFKQYDGMLYELVAPEGTVIPKGGGRDDAGTITNPVAALQKGMQASLGLEFQLEHIDYTMDNFIHADMTPEEFAESMKNNDESIGKMFLRAIGSSMALQNSGKSQGTELKLLRSLMSDDKSELREAMAAQMKDLESGMIMFEGREGSTIINHRNAKVMEVLQRELDSGKTRLAIFYGAGHLPDMQDRLLDDFSMKRGGRLWMDAWNLQSEENDSQDPEK